MEIIRYRSDVLAMRKGEQKALRLFHTTAVRVPAYKDFLKKNGVRAAQIKTIKDFSKVPITDPKNYIAAYPLAARCWDGKLSSSSIIATSSGTTGEPKFWPRSGEQELEAAMVHEWLYRTYFGIDKRSTLLLIGFPMGVYVSGMATLLPSWLIASKKYPVTVMSIGNNKEALLNAVRNLSGEYEQTVLIGHPFFIKDVIETGANEGIAWRKKNIGLMFCSGDFDEEWRGYLAHIAGVAPDAMRIFNTYGSSEMLLMGYETAFTIDVKCAVEKSPGFLNALCGNPMPPQFFQYDPSLRYIESINSELIFTAASGIPLVRFNLHDRGMVISLGDIETAAQYLPTPAMRLARPEYKLPLIAFWGRSDDTLKFNGVNIYPEHIKYGLANRRFLPFLTGKFLMRTYITKNMDQGWEINLELRPDISVKKKMAEEICSRVNEILIKINLEYADMSGHLKKEVRPRIVLWPYRDPKYFKAGLKPRFIERAKNKK